MKYIFILAMVLLPVWANAQMVNPILVNPTINNAFANGTAFQQTQTAGCATTATAGSCCNTVVNFPIAFKDGGYQIYCNCIGAAQGEPIIGTLAGVSNTQIFVSTCALTAAIAQCTAVECIGWHN